MANYCFCIPIRHGVIILAIFGVIAGLKVFYDGASFFYEREKTENLTTLLIKHKNQPQDAEKLTEIAMKYLFGAAITNLILGLLGIILSIALLMGVCYRHPTPLRIWVNGAIAGLIFSARSYVLVVAFEVVAHLEDLVPYTGIFFAMSIPLKVYCIYVVHKYAGILEDNNRLKEGVEQKA